MNKSERSDSTDIGEHQQDRKPTMENLLPDHSDSPSAFAIILRIIPFALMILVAFFAVLVQAPEYKPWLFGLEVLLAVVAIVWLAKKQ